MKSLIKPLQDIGVLTVALTFAFVANFAYGQWAEPAVAPTGGNIAVPINVSASNQVKSGGIGASTMAVGNGFAFSFVNTIDGANTAWRLENNDGTGNFLTYLNSLGGTAPTFETTGHAFKEIYSPGEGAYRFLTSSASGAAGGPITWRPAMTITANGNINVNQICDINGGNCSGPGGGVSVVADGRIPLFAQVLDAQGSTPAERRADWNSQVQRTVDMAWIPSGNSGRIDLTGNWRGECTWDSNENHPTSNNRTDFFNSLQDRLNWCGEIMCRHHPDLGAGVDAFVTSVEACADNNDNTCPGGLFRVACIAM